MPAQPVLNLREAGDVLEMFRGAKSSGGKALKLRKERYGMFVSGISMGVSEIVRKISIWTV